jgi:predicted RNase H-like nuclease
VIPFQICVANLSDTNAELPMNIIGIDCATQDKNIGVARGQLTLSRVEVLEVFVGDRAGSVLEYLVKSFVGEGSTLLALDAPLGWPAALGPALVGHAAGGHIPIEANTLFRRQTDACIKEKLDRQSLDVGADRIARTAHSALGMLHELAKRLSTRIPLAWNPQINRIAAIEVYPAATLAAYGIPARGYKEPDAKSARKEILDSLQTQLTLRCSINSMLADPDALDAAVCVLAGADFLRGDAHPPEDPALAAKEGWIWSRLRI